MDKDKLIEFLLKARTQTYTTNSGQVDPLLQGSKQMEYKNDEWLYRDIYNIGKGKFVGIETIYFKNKPVWSMSYYGNFEKMSEEEIDKILRKALKDKWDKARLWNNIKYEIDDYSYINEGSGSADEFDGSERIEKDNETLYFFYYASAIIG